LKKLKLKKIIKELFIGLVVLFIVSSLLNYIRQPTLLDRYLPDLITKTIDSKEIDIENYNGKPILIHFWATWCPICKMELSNIERVSKKYSVITIAVQSGSDEEIKEYIREHQVSFVVINDDDGKISKSFDVEIFPTTFIYGSSGEILFSEVGYSTTAGLISRMILAEKM